MYIDRGGDPTAFDRMSWSAVKDWLAVHDIMEVRQTLGGLSED